MTKLSKFGFQTECPWCGNINDAPDDYISWDCDTGEGEMDDMECGKCKGYYDVSFTITEIKWDKAEKNCNWGPICSDEIKGSCDCCEKAQDDNIKCWNDCEKKGEITEKEKRNESMLNSGLSATDN